MLDFIKEHWFNILCLALLALVIGGINVWIS